MKRCFQFQPSRLWLGMLGIVVAVVSLNPVDVLGQGGISLPPGSSADIPSTGQAIPQQPQSGQQLGQGQGQTGQGQQNQTGGQQTAQTNTGGGAVEIDPSQAVGFIEIENTRNQGFVGVAATRVTEPGFVGWPSDTSGPPLAEGATFGGGVNNGQGGSFSSTSRSGGFGAGGLGGGRGGIGRLGGNLGGGQFGTGSQNFFQVQRSGLRGAITPSFETAQVTNEQLVNNFNVSFSRLPQSQSFEGQYQVSVKDKRATVTGWVETQADANRLIAQLRFQPGIYSVDNQLEVRNK
jgi:hypothetical protein